MSQLPSPAANASITKNGDGTLIFNAVNTFRGLNIAAGTVVLTKASAISSAGGNIQLGSKTTNPPDASLLSTVAVANSVDVRNTGSADTVLTIGATLTAPSGFTFSGNVNLYNNIHFTSNATIIQLIASGVIQNGPTNVISSNVVKSGPGYVALSGNNTYVGQTIASSGILVAGAAVSANQSQLTTSAYSAGATTIALDSVAGLSVGEAIGGPGVPLYLSVSTPSDTISAIDPVANTVTLSRPIDSTFTAGAPVGTPLYFGTANPFGLSTSPILLGDASTTATGSSAAVFELSNKVLARDITVTNNPTTGTYYIGSRYSSTHRRDFRTDYARSTSDFNSRIWWNSAFHRQNRFGQRADGPDVWQHQHRNDVRQFRILIQHEQRLADLTGRDR